MQEMRHDRQERRHDLQERPYARQETRHDGPVVGAGADDAVGSLDEADGAPTDFFSEWPLELLWVLKDVLPTRAQRRFAATCWRYRNAFADHVEAALLPRQIPHYYRVKTCLEERGSALDASVMGSGKTHVACALARGGGMDLVVVCPKSVTSVWRDVADGFGLNACILTYAGMRRNGIAGLREGWIDKPPRRPPVPPTPPPAPAAPGDKRQREDTDPECGPRPAKRRRTKRSIEASPVAEDRPLLLVLDECQALKNASGQFRRARAIAQEVRRRPGGKVLLLSNTPVDAPDQFKRLCQLLGIVTRRKMARHDVHLGYVLEGFDELLQHCASDPRRPMSARKRAKFAALFAQERSSKGKGELVMRLFLRRIYADYCFAMPPPVIDASLDVKDGYYLVSRQAERVLREGLTMLVHATVAMWLNNNGGGGGGGGRVDWSGVGRALARIEEAKVDLLARLVEETLAAEPKAKVVCLLNYRLPMRRLAAMLARHSPLFMDGSSSAVRRKAVVAQFRDDPERRLLVANLVVASLGISLHDPVGDSPRYVFVVPNYYAMHMHQATRRVYREGTRSTATVRFVYCHGAIREARILHALARRAKVMRAMTDPMDAAMKYPGEHDVFIEIEDDPEAERRYATSDRSAPMY